MANTAAGDVRGGNRSYPDEIEVPSSQFADASSSLPVSGAFEVTSDESATENQQYESSANAPLLSSFPSQRTSFSLPRWLLVLVAFAMTTFGIRELIKPQHGKSAPFQTNRVDRVWACASKLSKSRVERKKHDPAMTRVVSWFLTGAGQDIAVPESDCDWNTPFATLYTLILIRETLLVPDRSWHTNKPLVDSSDVCQWKRIKCDNNHNIVALTLNHANITGTIPLELSQGLVNLTRLYLYCNDFIVGTLPSELGQLVWLEEVFVHKTSLTGTIPSHLGHLTLLNELLWTRQG